MAFPSVPSESKRKINQAGKLLTGRYTEEEFLWAWTLTNRWRACHAYPINTFQATLRSRVSQFPKNPVVAQRLKRMPTIIDKLRRYPAMQLTTMQDIAGVRAVVSSMAQVRKIVASYKKQGRFAHELVAEKDHINEPRDEDGYRSHHLIYKYRNRRNPQYDGLRLELQIRTKLQHVWATAVETMGTFLGQALKSRQGDKQWLDFFAVTSSAFALREKTTPISRFSHLDKDSICVAVAEAEARVEALDRMRSFSAVVHAIGSGQARTQATFYHLIVLNSLEQTVRLHAYGRDSLEQAMQDYSECEARASRGERIEPVLVSAGPINTLRKAYPNFFLDIEEFCRTIERMVQRCQ